MKKLEEFVNQKLAEVNKSRQEAQRLGNPGPQQSLSGQQAAYVSVLNYITDLKTKKKAVKK